MRHKLQTISKWWLGIAVHLGAAGGWIWLVSIPFSEDVFNWVREFAPIWIGVEISMDYEHMVMWSQVHILNLLIALAGGALSVGIISKIGGLIHGRIKAKGLMKVGKEIETFLYILESEQIHLPKNDHIYEKSKENILDALVKICGVGRPLKSETIVFLKEVKKAAILGRFEEVREIGNRLIDDLAKKDKKDATQIR